MFIEIGRKDYLRADLITRFKKEYNMLVIYLNNGDYLEILHDIDETYLRLHNYFCNLGEK